MSRFRQSRADSAMKKTLSLSKSLDESLLAEAAAKAFVHIPPATGANAIPASSMPVRNPISSPSPSPSAGVEVLCKDTDEAMPGASGTSEENQTGF